jgi:hypothetical protein
MHSNAKRFSRVPRLLVGGAWAADADRGAARAQHRQEWVRAKLDRDANRLEIKASQQAAWQDYAKARMSLADRKFVRPAQDADVAAIVKMRADGATEFAHKLTVLADSTAKLEAVLSPEQRQTLGQMVRHGHHRHGHHEWHRGPQGQRGDGPGHASDGDQNREEPAA